MRDITNAMRQSKIAISCLTRGNQENPWIEYEGGFLDGCGVPVCGFLINLSVEEVTYPLQQFQFTLFDKEDILDLLYELNRRCEKPINCVLLKETFESRWIYFERKFNEIIKNVHDGRVNAEEVNKLEKESFLTNLTDKYQKSLDSYKKVNEFLQEKREDKTFKKVLEKLRYLLTKVSKLIAEGRLYCGDMAMTQDWLTSKMEKGVNEAPLELIQSLRYYKKIGSSWYYPFRNYINIIESSFSNCEEQEDHILSLINGLFEIEKEIFYFFFLIDGYADKFKSQKSELSRESCFAYLDWEDYEGSLMYEIYKGATREDIMDFDVYQIITKCARLSLKEDEKFIKCPFPPVDGKIFPRCVVIQPSSL